MGTLAKVSLKKLPKLPDFASIVGARRRDDEKFAKLGWRFLNCGAYGSIFEHPDAPNLVVKTYADRCYSKFVKLAMGSKNIHFPKLANLQERDDYIGMVVMERLHNDTDPAYAYHAQYYRDNRRIAEEGRAFFLTSEKQQYSTNEYFDSFRNALQDMLKAAPGIRWDVHGGNFMCRHKQIKFQKKAEVDTSSPVAPAIKVPSKMVKIPVITDPWAG